jgi:hypothetical protein
VEDKQTQQIALALKTIVLGVFLGNLATAATIGFLWFIAAGIHEATK